MNLQTLFILTLSVLTILMVRRYIITFYGQLIPQTNYGRLSWGIIFILLSVISSCKKENNANTPTGGTVTPPKTSTSPNDTTFLSNGVNLQPSYYNNGNVDFGWSLMQQQSHIKSVRINIEPASTTQAIGWIAAAKAYGYQIIACYHKATVLGSDDSNEVIAAANWWATNYAALGGGFTINLINEWGSHNISASAFATTYNSAIAIVRTVYNGPIIIDIPGYGQETLTAYNAVKTSSPVITDKNIVLSTHIYPGNYNQGHGRTFQVSDLDELANTGRTCMVGEFGNGTGSCDWSACVDYAKSKNWPVLAWAWNGDGNNLNMVDPSWAVNATATAFTLNSYFNVVYPKL